MDGREFLDENPAALDLLNASTTREYVYFGVEIKLLTIGESLLATRFNIVVQPNDWTKTVRPVDLIETQEMQFEFWTEFGTLMESQGDVPYGGASASPYTGPNTGISGIQVRSAFSTWSIPTNSGVTEELRVARTFGGGSAQSLFEQVSESGEESEQEAGREYPWYPQTHGTNPRAFAQRDAEVQNRGNRLDYRAWLKTEVERMFEVRVPSAKALVV